MRLFHPEIKNLPLNYKSKLNWSTPIMLSLRTLWDHQSLFHNARELTYLYCRALPQFKGLYMQTASPRNSL